MKNYLPKSIVLFCLSALLLSGCNDQTDAPQGPYLKPSLGSLTFLGDDAQPQILEVAASSDWEATPSATWIKLDVTATTIVVSVNANETDMERNGKITIVSDELTKEVAVCQFPKDSEFAIYRRPKVAQALVISPNGKYAGGYLMDIDSSDAYTYRPVIIDLETDERYEFGPYPASLFKIQKSECINDNGQLILKDTDGAILFDLEDMDYTLVGSPAGFQGRPGVAFTSSDGSIWVGYTMKAGSYYPLVWKDGVAQELEWPATDFRENAWDPELTTGLMARGCSADGRIIYGSTWTNTDYGMVYWDETGKIRWVGEEDTSGVGRVVTPVKMLDFRDQWYDKNLVNGMRSISSQHHISPNGKYITGDYCEEALSENKREIVETFYPAFFNTETKKLTIFRDQVGNMAMCASDDGVGFIGHGRLGITSGVAVDIENETLLGTTQEWVKENYGITVPIGYIEYVCAGNKSLLGMMAVPGGPQGVYFLNWYVAPPLKK